MNQIVIDNKHKISTACALCFYELNKYSDACNAFREKVKSIAKTMYIEQEKERMVNKEAEYLLRKATANYEEILRQLETIKTCTEEMDDLLDIGRDLQDALSTVGALGDDTPYEVLRSIVDRFRGQKKALLVLKAAYEKANISADIYFKGAVFATGDRINGLADTAHKIVVQPSENLLCAAEFAMAMEALARDMGVELSVRFKDLANLDAAYTEALYKAAGV